MSLPSIFYMIPWWNVAIALGIAAAMSAIGWMLAEALRSSELKAWSKKELTEFFITVSILSVIVLVVAFAESITTAMVGTDYFESAKTHLSEMRNLLFTTAYDLSLEASFYAVFTKMRIDLGTFVTFAAMIFTGGAGAALGLLDFIGITVMPFDPLSNATGALVDSIKFIFTVYMLVVGQITLLDFIEKTMLTIILPLGVLFRAFPLTRKTGSTLIAISLIAYFVYPLSIDIGGVIYDKVSYLMPKNINIEKIVDVGGNVAAIDISPMLTMAKAKVTSAKWALYGNGTYRLWYSLDKKCPDFDPEISNSSINPNSGKSWECSCLVRESGLFCDECSGSSSSFYNNGEKSLQQPPFDPANPGEYSKWVIKYYGVSSISPDYICYTMIKNGTFKGKLSYITNQFSTSYENREQSYLMDVYNSSGNGTTKEYSAGGMDDITVFIGDPKSSDWTAAEERMGKIVGMSSVSTRGSYIKFVESIFQAMNNLGSELVQVQGSYSPLIIITNPPMLASAVYLSITDRMPRIIIPVVTILFTFVISFILTISTFKGVSPAFGGESDIPGLGKLL